MPLSFQSRSVGDITVVKCDGRIIEGAEPTLPGSFCTWETFTSSTAAAWVSWCESSHGRDTAI